MGFKQYLKKILIRFKTKLENIDTDFWGDVRLIDMECDENVWYCFAIYEPINRFNYSNDCNIYIIWFYWNSFIW